MIERRQLVADIVSRGILVGVIDAFRLLTRREQFQAIGLVISMSVNAVLGLIGLAGLFPFIRLMLDPTPLTGDGLTARTFRALGIVDVDHALFAIGLGIVVLVLARNLWALANNRLQNTFCGAAEARLGTELVRRIVRAPYVWLVMHNSSILRDIAVGHSVEWSRGVIRATLQLINDSVFLLLAFALIVVTSPAIGLLISVVASLLSGALLFFSRPHIAYHANVKRRHSHSLGLTATEAITGGRDVRISRVGKLLLSSFEKEMTIYSKAEGLGRQWQMVPRLGIEVIGFSLLVGVAIGALWSGVPKADVAAVLTLYAVIAVRAVPMMSQIVVGVTGIAAMLPAVSTIRRLLQEIPPEEVSFEPDSVSRISWETIRIDRVTVYYPNAAIPALGPISLSVKRGKSYGIFGASGAGKSTLADLIAGLLMPTSGHILIDGSPLQADLARWRDGIAYVAQTPFMLDATLADNIEFGEPKPPDRDARLMSAIAAAGLTDLVSSLPDGLATQLGERGVRLSGGQRQRVAIARALYRNANLLILDEATSSLDSLTEREITDAIEVLKDRMTLVIIAHRLSTLVHCDEIFMLEGGLLVDQGAHLSLLTRNPMYRRFAEAQNLPSSIDAVIENSNLPERVADD